MVFVATVLDLVVVVVFVCPDWRIVGRTGSTGSTLPEPNQTKHYASFCQAKQGKTNLLFEKAKINHE